MEAQEVFDRFHRWYVSSPLWGTSYLGVPIVKCVFDLWNYQDIITNMKPSLIVEFGTNIGGSALWFANLLDALKIDGKVFTVDILDIASNIVKEHPKIELFVSNSTDESVANRIRELRETYPGKIFAILDSNHTKGHVFAEMELLRNILVTGDFLVVEDGNINGHPVLPDWGEGPFEAIAEYIEKYPNDYVREINYERRFGFTFAVNGYLRRT